MGVFKDEDELYTYLAGIFERAIDHDEIGPKIARAGLNMRVDYSDPDATMLVNMEEGEVYTGEDAEPRDWDVSLAMTADDGHAFWLGHLNFTVAMTKGRIRTKGPVTELLKLLPLARPLFAEYEQMLKEHGREDLLDVQT